jgi:hypothetical protein
MDHYGDLRSDAMALTKTKSNNARILVILTKKSRVVK